MGTHRPKTWFMTAEVVRRIGETPTASRWALDSSGSDMKVNSVHVSLTSAGNMCPLTTQTMRRIQTTTMLSTMTTPSRKSSPRVRTPQRLEEWSSRCHGEAMGHPLIPWISSFPLYGGSTAPLWSMSAGTTRSSRSLTWKLSPGRLQLWATDPRPELSPEWAG